MSKKSLGWSQLEVQEVKHTITFLGNQNQNNPFHRHACPRETKSPKTKDHSEPFEIAVAAPAGTVRYYIDRSDN